MDNQEPIVKRAYIKRSNRWNIGTTQENPVQVAETPINKLSEIPVRNIDSLTFEDLPESTRIAVEKSILFDKLHNPNDDGEKRRNNAVKYRKWELENRI